MIRLWENANPTTRSSPTLIQIDDTWEHGDLYRALRVHACLFSTKKKSFMPGKLLIEGETLDDIRLNYPEYFI